MFKKIKQFFNPCRICEKRKYLEKQGGFVGCICTLGFIGVIKKNLTIKKLCWEEKRSKRGTII